MGEENQKKKKWNLVYYIYIGIATICIILLLCFENNKVIQNTSAFILLICIGIGLTSLGKNLFIHAFQRIQDALHKEYDPENYYIKIPNIPVETGIFLFYLAFSLVLMSSIITLPGFASWHVFIEGKDLVSYTAEEENIALTPTTTSGLATVKPKFSITANEAELINISDDNLLITTSFPADTPLIYVIPWGILDLHEIPISSEGYVYNEGFYYVKVIGHNYPFPQGWIHEDSIRNELDIWQAVQVSNL